MTGRKKALIILTIFVTVSVVSGVSYYIGSLKDTPVIENVKEDKDTVKKSEENVIPEKKEPERKYYNVDGMQLSEYEYKDYIEKQDTKKNKEFAIKLLKEYETAVEVLGSRKVTMKEDMREDWIAFRNDMEIEKRNVVKMNTKATIHDKLLLAYKSKLLEYIDKKIEIYEYYEKHFWSHGFDSEKSMNWSMGMARQQEDRVQELASLSNQISYKYEIMK